MINSGLLTLPMTSESILDASLLEIIGKTGISSALKLSDVIRVNMSGNTSKSKNHFIFQPLEAALETIYGSQAGAGIACRVGQVSFKNYLTVFGKRLGFSEIKFRLLPMNQRKYEGLKRISEELKSSCRITSMVHNQKSHFIVEIYDWSGKKRKKSQSLACHFIKGFLQEYLAWMSGGKYNPVREIRCVTKGHPSCIYELSKIAID
jgi:predicted hydrocarbon binding protein